MTSLTLPELPEGIYKSYESSGKCPPMTKSLMLIVGIPSAVLSGFIGFHMFALIAGFLVGIVGSDIPWQVTAIATIVAFAYGFIPGLIAGLLIAYVGRLGKCRSGSVAFIVGLAGGIVGAGVMLWLFINNMDAQPETWLLVAWAIEFVIATIFLVAGVTLSPFCEIGEHWYSGMFSEPKKVILPIELADSFIQSVTSGTLKLPSKINRKYEKPYIQIEADYCTECGLSPHILKSQIVWDETPEKERKKSWITTMVPHTLGKELLKSLPHVVKWND